MHARRVFVLGIAAALSAAFAIDAAQSPAPTASVMTVTCSTAVLNAPWTGSDTVTCAAAPAEPPAEISFSCEAPAGMTCSAEPSRVQGRAGEEAKVTVRVTYTEALAPGRSAIRVVAQQPSAMADAQLSVNKDINTVSERCPSAAEIRDIDRELRLVFSADPTKGTLGCTASAGSRDLSIMQGRVYRALATMKRLTFTTPLPWTRDPVYRWLTRTVRGVNFRGDVQNSMCCGPDRLISVRAAVNPGPFGGQQGFMLAITESSQMPTDFRMLAGFLQLLVHEARHADGKPHTCGTRDQTLTELGGWGAAHAFQTWIADRMAPGFIPDAIKANLRQQTDQICRAQICQGC